MKTRLFNAAVFLIMGLAPTLLLAVAVQGAEPETLSPGGTFPPAYLTPTPPITSHGPQDKSFIHRKTILLWPKKLSPFMKDYASWEMWLGSRSTSPYSLRDELLVSVRAIATTIPDLEIGTDEPRSDIIAVSGNPLALNALLSRLRDHPLMAQATEASPAQRDEARRAWTQSDFEGNYSTSQQHSATTVNIRNSRVNNVVWGYSTPEAIIQVTLIRSSSHVLTTTTAANAEGLYHAYLAWDIRDGDVVAVEINGQVTRVTVPQIRISVDTANASVSGTVSPPIMKAGHSLQPSLDVVVGNTDRKVSIDSEGGFKSTFDPISFRPGTPGFLIYRDTEGNRIYMPLTISFIAVRRDTYYGLPWNSAHGDGISSIVWGYSNPNAALVVTLTQAGGPTITRTTVSDQFGRFSVSVDRLIMDGDRVRVSEGALLKTVNVPTMTYAVDPSARIITGTAPANITDTGFGAPHSLEISIGGTTHQITTTATGGFRADYTDSPYLAGLLGAMRYTTPDGDYVFKPLFVAEPFARGKPGDWWADVILGQPDFNQITPNEVAGNKLFNPMGTLVDRSTQPNRVYIYDGGNNRVLGLSYLGYAQGGPNDGQPCTSNSDYPGSICQIQEYRSADIVLGQPSFNTSACNGDSGYQLYPEVPMASRETLCTMREEQLSITEGGSGATMATDAQGNLYVPDFFNNRVLRYNSPFTTDALADYVWGQADFSGTTCNRGAGLSWTDAKSLCFSPPPRIGDLRAGVAIDSGGNLWVADNNNNRVLRFPFDSVLGRPAPEANLVLGQPDFMTNVTGTGLSQMNKPNSVRVVGVGAVYVTDSLNNRVLVFQAPFSNGMSANKLLGSGLQSPNGLEIDPNGGIWVNDAGNNRLLYFVNDFLQKTVDYSFDTAIWAGVGVDRDSNLIVTGGAQVGYHFASPTYQLDARFLRSDPEGMYNQTGSKGVFSGIGLEVTTDQLIYADTSRLLYWNHPWSLTNFQAADGVIGEPDFQTRTYWTNYGRMRADKQGRLWVTYLASSPAEIHGYQLPLKTGATPVFTITSPLPLQGGGIFTWTEGIHLGGIDIQPACECLWLSDELNHRVFRIRNITSQPVVDIVLGQTNVSGTQCNQGRGLNSPSRNSLCNPGALAFDKAGNLYIADHNLEFDGNLRLLEFDANTIPASPTSAVFGIPASRVFGRNGSFTEPNCLFLEQDPMCGPWEPAFDSRGRMVIGFNGYLGPRFPMVYQNPLTNPLPVAALGDFHSMPLSARFDRFDNLYILDGNRMRILIYRDRQVQTYIVTGTIKTESGNPVPSVQVEIVGYAASGLSAPSGVYTLTGLITGTYILIPSKDYYTFTPITRTISIPGAMGGQDFIAHTASWPIYLPLILHN